VQYRWSLRCLVSPAPWDILDLTQYDLPIAYDTFAGSVSVGRAGRGHSPSVHTWCPIPDSAVRSARPAAEHETAGQVCVSWKRSNAPIGRLWCGSGYAMCGTDHYSGERRDQRIKEPVESILTSAVMPSAETVASHVPSGRRSRCETDCGGGGAPWRWA
jgi:hypothetical protein